MKIRRQIRNIPMSTKYSSKNINSAYKGKWHSRHFQSPEPPASTNVGYFNLNRFPELLYHIIVPFIQMIYNTNFTFNSTHFKIYRVKFYGSKSAPSLRKVENIFISFMLCHPLRQAQKLHLLHVVELPIYLQVQHNLQKAVLIPMPAPFLHISFQVPSQLYLQQPQFSCLFPIQLVC